MTCRGSKAFGAALAFLMFLAVSSESVLACTAVYVGSGASKDGTTIIAKSNEAALMADPLVEHGISEFTAVDLVTCQSASAREGAAPFPDESGKMMRITGYVRNRWMRLFSAVLAFCLAAAFCAQGAVVIEPKKGEVASGQETVAASEVGTEYMVPVTAGDLEEGTYEITVDSSSSMFKIVGCELSASGGEMTAAVTLSGTAYTWLFAGTAEEAAAAGEEDYIPFEDVDGKYVYSFPVHALNEETPCAAFSKNKEKWYDRTLVFRADTIPEEKFSEAVKEKMAKAESKAAEEEAAAAGANTAAGDSAGPGAEIVPETRAAEVHEDLSEPSRRLDISDGDYTAEVTLEGGSGKASVTSPVRIRVKDGQAEAAIEWSSPNYDYMIVNIVCVKILSTKRARFGKRFEMYSTKSRYCQFSRGDVVKPVRTALVLSFRKMVTFFSEVF